MKVLKNIFAKSLVVSCFIGTAFAGIPSDLTKQDAGAKVILNLTHGKAVITQEFQAVGNINGYVISPKEGGQSVIIYADKDGQYMFVGSLMDSAGNSLSNNFNQKYVVSVTAKAALKDAASTTWFVDGKDSAPHKAYILP